MWAETLIQRRAAGIPAKPIRSGGRAILSEGPPWWPPPKAAQGKHRRGEQRCDGWPAGPRAEAIMRRL